MVNRASPGARTNAATRMSKLLNIGAGVIAARYRDLLLG
jgi:hypothetical protein